MKDKLIRAALVLVLSFSTVAHLEAAQNKPVELSADVLEYNSVQGIINAEGNVRMVQENAVLTGSKAEYNSKTKEAYVLGNVKVVKDNATLTAAEVRSYDNTHMVATGDPVLTKDDNKLSGPKLDYYSDKQYAVVTGWGQLTTLDGIMTANQIESFFSEDRAVADGNVHIVSETRNMDATADQAIYYSNKDQQGKIVLTGNARAVQDGNVLTGNVLTLYMDNQVIDVQGRSKLVITPQ